MVLNSANLVPVPNKGVIISKAGKYPYLYRVISTFRNEKGQPTNTKVSIGKLDNTTGLLIHNSAYYQYYGEAMPLVNQAQLEGGETLGVGVPFVIIQALLVVGGPRDTGEILLLI
ncbi:MAG: hypothetical protein LBV23_10310 [Deltaproteobacteria bacterium]|jgi:hypothetical protein|nr:hypothetical protein [Deltaproteobacteria bacterium]